MGFDICGVKPTSKEGEYFRNNVWYWRPLCHIIEETCHQLLTEKQLNGLGFNDGVLYRKKKAIQIAERLEELLKDKDRVNNMVEKFQRAIDVSVDVNTKPQYNEYGKNINPAKQEFQYPFDVENVEKFIEFAKNSGGFRIY